MLRFIMPLSISIMLTACAGSDVKTPSNSAKQPQRSKGWYVRQWNANSYGDELKRAKEEGSCLVINDEIRGAYKGLCDKDHLATGYGTSRGKGTYEGHFRYGTKHGHGTLISADGSKYTGQFEYGFYHGQGTLISADGSKYTGQFKNGKTAEEAERAEKIREKIREERREERREEYAKKERAEIRRTEKVQRERAKRDELASQFQLDMARRNSDAVNNRTRQGSGITLTREAPYTPPKKAKGKYCMYGWKRLQGTLGESDLGECKPGYKHPEPRPRYTNSRRCFPGSDNNAGCKTISK